MIDQINFLFHLARAFKLKIHWFSGAFLFSHSLSSQLTKEASEHDDLLQMA